METVQTMRADARRNYESLIRVASEHLARHGVSTSLEAIAREAGVGVGTLYRHFPDRDHLVVATLNAQGEHLRAESERIRETVPAEHRLDRWLGELEAYLTTFQGLPDSVAQAMDRGECSPLAVTCQEIMGITEEFLVAAQRLGSVRDSVTAQDLVNATLSLAWLSSRCADDADPPNDTGDPARADGLRAMLRHGYRK